MEYKEMIRRTKLDLVAKYNGVKIVDYDLHEKQNNTDNIIDLLALFLVSSMSILVTLVVYGII